VGDIYRCEVNNNPNITTEESAQINGITGIHEISKSNDDITSFDAHGKKIEIFPKGR